MRRGNVISGAEPPQVQLEEGEAVAAFAQWLLHIRANGTIPFDVLAQRFIVNQGWTIEDPRFMARLRTMPETRGYTGDDPADFRKPPEPELSPLQEDVVQVPSGPNQAVIISGGSS